MAQAFCWANHLDLVSILHSHDIPGCRRETSKWVCGVQDAHSTTSPLSTTLATPGVPWRVYRIVEAQATKLTR